MLGRFDNGEEKQIALAKHAPASAAIVADKLGGIADESAAVVIVLDGLVDDERPIAEQGFDSAGSAGSGGEVEPENGFRDLALAGEDAASPLEPGSLSARGGAGDPEAGRIGPWRGAASGRGWVGEQGT